ncbi:hypothetical protein Tsubulata_045113 [Turnera subulata]|uniref:Peptidase A1 domain-containing protein n=1 Tax=Turnera subulata TaxID=218843 RepID=A0A9Q0FV68_9ROSI|nr:hypothetical protein Tsubulata_045113 [Turnera subulata]
MQLYVIFFILLFTSSPLVSSSRILPKKPKTAVLDVAAAIAQTKHVLSSSPKTALPANHQQKTDSPFSMQLHTRTSIQGTTHTDYRSLTLARLERDSARVRSLTTRLDLAVNGIATSDLKPLDEAVVEFGAESIQGPIVSGTSQGSGEYFSRVGIGTPPSDVYVVLDTGSDVNWVQCAPCADCYQQADPIFDPASSSSFTPLNCKTKQCMSLDVSECRNDTCLYEVSYGDGSYTVGDFVTESITLGSASVDNVAVGCGHTNEGLFIGAAGLLGLGGGSLSFPAQLNATSFSYCLVDRDSDSASTLEFDSAPPPNAVTAPLLRNHEMDTFYYLGLSGMSVGGELLSIPDSAFRIDESGNGGIIVDSGTAVTRLQTEAYHSLRDAFVRGTRGLPSVNSSISLFDTCYDLSGKSSVEVPTVSFHFPGGKELSLPAKNYLIPVDSDGTFCFAFASTASSLSIIGNVQQQGIRVGFNLADSSIAFVPSTC